MAGFHQTAADTMYSSDFSGNSQGFLEPIMWKSFQEQVAWMLETPANSVPAQDSSSPFFPSSNWKW